MDLQQLNIRIASDSSKAQTAIDALIGTLDKLNQSIGKGLNVTRLSNNLQAIAKASQNLQGDTGDKLTKLSAALKTFDGLSKININKNLANNITQISVAASMIPADVSSKLGDIAQGITSLGSVGKVNVMSTLGQNLQSVANAANSINPASLSNLKAIANGIRSLNGLSRVNISSTLADHIFDLGFAISSLQGVPLDRLQDIADNLQPLSSVKNTTGFNNTVAALEKFPAAITGLQSIDIDDATKDIERLVKALQPLSTVATQASQSLNTLAQSVGNNSSTGSNRTLAASVTSFGNTMKRLTSFLGVNLGSATLGSFLLQSNKYVEDLNLFTVAMGKSAKGAQEFAQKVGQAMGIDPADWMRNQGIFQTLATGFGVSSTKAEIMSKNLTQLGYDLSSFFNISVADAMQKLQSGISGELEPLRRLGYDLSQTRLKAIALQHGIKQSFNEMNQAQKSQLRYVAIMSQVTTAQGDMARTLQSPANQIRILQSQFTQLARAIGNIFIPALNRVLPYITAVTQALRQLADRIAGFFGFTLPEIDYSGISGIGDAADEAGDSLSGATGKAKKLKDMLADFDELNVLSDNSSSGGGGSKVAGLGDDLALNLPTYDFLDGVKNRINDITKELSDWWDKWSPSVIAFGAGLLAWAGFEKIINTIRAIKEMQNKNIALNLAFAISGIVMSAMALKDIVLQGDLSWENILQDAFGVALETYGLGYIAKNQLHMSKGAAFGAGFGIALVIHGITLGIMSNIKASTDGLDWDTIGNAAMAGIEDAIGLQLATSFLATKFNSIARLGLNKPIFSIGVGFLISGINMAIQNVGDIALNGWDPKNSWATIASSLMTGLGVGLVLSVGGVPMAAAVGAALAIGFSVGVIQLLFAGTNNSKPEIVIPYGDIEYTKEQVRWKAESMLQIPNVTTKVNGIQTVIDEANIELSNEKAAIQKIDDVVASLNQKVTKVQLGIDTKPGSTLLNEIKVAIQGEKDKDGKTITRGLIDDINDYLGEKQNQFEVFIKLNPKLAETDTNLWSVESFGIDTEVLTTAFSTLGDNLSAALTQAAKVGLEESGLQEEIMYMYTALTEAQALLTTGTKKSEYLRTTDEKLSDLSRDSYNAVLTEYQQIQKSYYDTMLQYNQSVKDGIYGQYLAALRLAEEAERQGNHEEVNRLKAVADNSLSRWKNYDPVAQTVEDVKRDSASGERQIAEAFSTLFAEGIDNAINNANVSYVAVQGLFDKITNAESEQAARKIFDDFIVSVLSDAGMNKLDTEALRNTANALGSSIFETMPGDLRAKMIEALFGGEKYGAYETDINQAVLQIFKKTGTDLEGIFKGVNIGSVNTAPIIMSLNAIIGAANRAGQAIANVTNGTHRDIPFYEVSPIQKAEGGFVDEGQMFVAREAGPELVGSIGRRTAVANNEQIVASVAGGVSEANGEVVEALGVIADILRSQGGSRSNAGGNVQPSAAFGRFVQRSLELYGGVTG